MSTYNNILEVCRKKNIKVSSKNLPRKIAHKAELWFDNSSSYRFSTMERLVEVLYNDDDNRMNGSELYLKWEFEILLDHYICQFHSIKYFLTVDTLFQTYKKHPPHPDVKKPIIILVANENGGSVSSLDRFEYVSPRTVEVLNLDTGRACELQAYDITLSYDNLESLNIFKLIPQIRIIDYFVDEWYNTLSIEEGIQYIPIVGELNIEQF